jgi:hypothetical protein
MCHETRELAVAQLRLLRMRESTETRSEGVTMRTKEAIAGVEIKSEAQGLVSAVIATIGVIDADEDYTFPGAFTAGEKCDISQYGHSVYKGGMPIGEGELRVEGREAIVDAQFYMDTTAGRDAFHVVKARGARQQWSYGYDVLNRPETVMVSGRKANALRKLRVNEASPVWRGAGLGTRTLSAKEQKEGTEHMPTDYLAAIKRHDSPVTIKAWNFADLSDYLPESPTIDDLRALHAYVDPTGDPADVKSYDFAHHHEVDGDANLRAAMAGIGRLLKSDHGLSEAEADAVWDHLAGHLDDGDVEVPERRSESGLIKLNAELAVVLADWSSVRGRVWETKRSRTLKGKALGATTVMILGWIADDQIETKSLLDSPQEEADREFARFIRSQLIEE